MYIVILSRFLSDNVEGKHYQFAVLGDSYFKPSHPIVKSDFVMLSLKISCFLGKKSKQIACHFSSKLKQFPIPQGLFQLSSLDLVIIIHWRSSIESQGNHLVALKIQFVYYFSNINIRGKLYSSHSMRFFVTLCRRP